MNQWPNPFIEQRADLFILRDGSHYYFIASVPEYDRPRSAGQTLWGITHRGTRCCLAQTGQRPYEPTHLGA